MKKKVLVVDNDPVALWLMSNLLEKEGHQVQTAENGLSALEILKKYTPDVMFVDLIMPKIDGKKLIRIIRKMPELKDVRIAIVSAIAVEEQIAFTELGADACIAKGPFEQMTKHILAALEHSDQDIAGSVSEDVVGLQDIQVRGITKELISVERHYEAILNNISAGIIEFTPEGKIVFANPAAVFLTGTPEEKLLGLDFCDLFAENDRKRVRDLLTRDNEAPQTIVMGTPVLLNGHHISLNVLPVEEAGRLSVIAILDDVTEATQAREVLKKAHDELEQRVKERTAELKHSNERLKREITNRRQAEEVLRESEEKYRTLFEDSLEAMSLTQNRKIVDVNPAWLRLHGYDNKDEVTGTDIKNVIYPSDQKVLIERRATWSSDKEGIYAMRDLRKDGSLVDVEVCSSGITLGGIDARLATIRDVTERNRAEAKRRDLENKLRHSEKMEAIGLLAGRVAHDLNNILSGLVSYPELLLLKLPKESPLTRPLLIIRKSGEKAAAIVQDMLTLARRGVVSTEGVNLNDIISGYLVSPEYDSLKKYHPRVLVETNLEEGLLNMLGSPPHLSKTVMNLVSNAAEAMPGGGKISLSTQGQYIEKPTESYDNVKPGDYAVLTVSDTGIGISQDDIERIFEPFYTKKKMGRSGTGLGMMVVWGAVKDHKGYINVRSTEGKGTTFTLYFPVTRKVLTKHELRLPIEVYKGSGESILVVDDMEEQRAIATEMVKELGYSVVSVSSGEEAVEYLRSNRVDLLLLDMIMDPGMDGLDTYKQILELYPGTKAVIASGFSETDRVREAQKLGAGQYIKKPYALEKVGVAIKKELEK